MEEGRQDDGAVMIQRKSKYPVNVTECVMNRDLHDRNRHCKNRKAKYHNPYQLFESVKPKRLVSADLNEIEMTEFGPRPADLAECLGFSPNGRYLVFHTHSKSAITLCCYNGVEGTRPDERRPYLTGDEDCMFSHSDIFTLTDLPDYDPTPVYCSWWTDDSSTIIIVFKQDRKGPEPWNEANEGDILYRFERLQRSVSLNWTRSSNGPEVAAQGPQEPDMEDPPMEEPDFEPSSGEEEPSSGGEEQSSGEEEPSSGEEVDSDASDPELGGTGTELDKMTGCLCILKSSMSDPEVEAAEFRNRDQTPFRNALVEMRNRDEQKEEQCSRTMSVYHNYQTSSALRTSECPASSSAEPPVPIRIPSARFEIWVRSKIPEPQRPPFRGHKEGPEVKLPEICDPPRWNRPKKLDPTGLFQQVFEETERFSVDDFVHQRAPTDKERVFLVVAYNFRTGIVSPLKIANSQGKFHCNMRDRVLTVVNNGDFVDTFYLGEQDNKWQRAYRSRLSSKSNLMCPVRYRTDTVPGMISRLPFAVTGDALNDLYDTSMFHSPMIQDAKTLLYRDHEEWFRKHENIRAEKPHITRCHILTDNLMAVTVTHHFGPTDRPIHHGLIMDLATDRTTLYPNYTEFLNIMFTHHLTDLFPRQFTYHCPHPVHLQPWFRNYFLDVSDPDDLCNYVTMKSYYDLMYERLKNNKCFANPLNDAEYYDDEGLDFMTNYIHTDYETSRDIATIYRNGDLLKYTEKFFHPFDPFYIFRSGNIWTARMPNKAAKDVIIKEGESV